MPPLPHDLLTAVAIIALALLGGEALYLQQIMKS